jgi:hypothetical protein
MVSVRREKLRNGHRSVNMAQVLCTYVCKWEQEWEFTVCKFPQEWGKEGIKENDGGGDFKYEL